jgi:hypothetical protein
LPLILQQCAQDGLIADNADASERLVQLVSIYHPVPDAERSDYATALLAAYRAYLQSRHASR